MAEHHLRDHSFSSPGGKDIRRIFITLSTTRGSGNYLRKLSYGGHQVGLHGSASNFEQPDEIRQEFGVLRAVALEENIQQATWGGCQHYLRWDPARTWKAWAEAGLDYDSMVAYSEMSGFR